MPPTPHVNGTVPLTPDAFESLILDLLEWIGPFARPYVEVLDAWRTSCPRFPVWEEARERGFVELQRDSVRGECVAVSVVGAEHLWASRP